VRAGAGKGSGADAGAAAALGSRTFRGTAGRICACAVPSNVAAVTKHKANKIREEYMISVRLW
jgi:hypothetical protein